MNTTQLGFNISKSAMYKAKCGDKREESWMGVMRAGWGAESGVALTSWKSGQQLEQVKHTLAFP